MQSGKTILAMSLKKIEQDPEEDEQSRCVCEKVLQVGVDEK
jgi:hypothetical protein